MKGPTNVGLSGRAVNMVERLHGWLDVILRRPWTQQGEYYRGRADGLRSADAQLRTSERLLIRGNTLCGVVAATLARVADGAEIPVEELRQYEHELRAWGADIRSLASEQRP